MAMVEKVTRVDDAYARLKQEILLNRMPAGALAPEPEIAERLAMSRTPVREALIKLEAEGRVELVPRRGARVLSVSEEDMSEIYSILTALEPEAAADLARRGGDADALAPLDAATNAMEQALVDDDLDAWAAADDQFHRMLLALHGNRRMTAMAGQLYDQAHRARMVTLRLRAKPERSTQDHRAMLERLRAGDPDGVRAATELLSVIETLRLPQL